MSRFLFSNNQSVVEDFRNHCFEAGFKKYVFIDNHVSSQGYYGVSFQKLSISAENTAIYDNGFVTIVGTCFYKEQLSSKVLSEIFHDFLQSKDIYALRKNMIGMYSVTIMVDGNCYFFTDPNGLYYTYYYYNKEKDKWIVSTSLYEMAKSLNNSLSLNEYNVVEEVFSYSITGDGTYFNEVKKLNGDNYIIVKSTDIFCVEEFPQTPIAIYNDKIDDIVKIKVETCHRLANIVKRNFGNDVALCMTGGLDARTILASFLSEDIKPSLYYGVGNSQLTNTFKGDLDVNRIYSQEYGLNFTEMDWSTPERINSGWDYYINKYGMMAKVYSASPGVMNSYENVSNSIMFLGFFGEMYRNVPMIENLKDDFIGVDAIIDNFYIEGDVKHVIGAKKYKLYREYLRNKIYQILKPYLVNGDLLHRDYFSIFELHKRCKSDTAQLNLINQNRYCFAFLGEPLLLNEKIVPVNYKTESLFQLKLIKSIFPDILRIPIFSRCTWKKYDVESDTIIAKHSYFNDFISVMVRSQFGKSLRRILRPIMNKYKQRNVPSNTMSNQIIGKQLDEIIAKNNIFHHTINSKQSEYISKESRYAMLLFIFSKLNIKTKNK